MSMIINPYAFNSLWGAGNIALEAHEWNASKESSISEDDVAGLASQIDDLLGTEHLTATGAQQPATGSRTINGLNTLDFDGVGNRMAKTSFPVDSSGDIAIFIFAEIDPFTSTKTLCSMNAPDDDFNFGSESTTQFDGQIVAEGIGSDVSLTGGPFAGPSTYNLNFDFTGVGVYNAYIDGVQRAVNTTYSTKLNASQALGLFRARNGAARPAGAFCHMIVTTDVTAATRLRIEGLFAHTWEGAGVLNSLDGGHIYKDKPPFNN